MSSLRNVYRNLTSPEGQMLTRFLSDDGSGVTGNRDITGDYSSVPMDFYIQPPNDHLWYVREIGGVVSAPNNAALIDYGSVVGGLTTGLRFFVETDGQEIEVTGSSNYKSNADLLSNGNSGFILDYGSNQKLNKFFLSSLTDTSSVRLDGAKNMKLIVRVNDNFTALEAHSLYVHIDSRGAATGTSS